MVRFAISQLEEMQALLDEYHTLAADVTVEHSALFLRNDETPARPDGNQVRRIRDVADLDALVRAIEERYAHLPYRAVLTDYFTPPDVQARLILEGYELTGMEIVMAAVEAPGGHPADAEIREEAAASPALALLVEANEGADAAAALTLIRRRGAAFTWYVAFEGGQPIGHLSQRTKGSLGSIESLFVLPQFRNRGVATALLQHADAACRAAGATLTFLPTYWTDTPRLMYAKLGFEPVFPFQHWLKRIP